VALAIEKKDDCVAHVDRCSQSPIEPVNEKGAHTCAARNPACSLAELTNGWSGSRIGRMSMPKTTPDTTPDTKSTTMNGPIETAMRAKLETAFQPIHLVLENESHTHNVAEGSETHFKLLLVSKKFEGIPRIGRQRLVHDCLKVELQPGAVHALTQRLLSPQEWIEQGVVDVESPPCFGGSKLK
jgi:stress-induced morphogen